ncbi:hypothetical protein ACLBXM_04190 [Xanthobacteraceae bacterium A53D]
MSTLPDDPAAFWRLRDEKLHLYEAADFAAYYPQMARWLTHEDATIRPAAVERLCMAVFSAEPYNEGQRPGEDQSRARLAWLLGEIEAAARAHPDVMGAMLAEMRWHGENEPFRTPLIAWLEGLRGDPRFSVPDARIEAALVLIGGYGQGEAARPALIALLDHESDYVRCCAAHRMSETFEEEPDLAFFDWLRDKEIARPGIFGSFWGGLSPEAGDLPFEPATYLLDIIARRSGPEPADMPFNGVDFYLHEIGGASTEVVRRLIDLGEYETAILTATEEDIPVAGMADLLDELGRVDHPAVAATAHAHLAMVYHAMHDRADPRHVRHLPHWQPGVDAFAMRQGNAEHWRDAVALYPAAGEADFDDATAWRLIDLALPPQVRGAEVRHWLAFGESETLVLIMGEDEDHAFASGALVTLTGDHETRRWRRLKLIGRGLQKTWAPLDWT